jgi:uncharacterized membrane protein
MAGAFAGLIPDPLHPSVVHLPIALAVLVPLFAIGGLIAVSRGARPMRSWSIAVAMFAALTASALISKETGEDQEEKVERVVPEAAFETHEDAADAFTTLSMAVLAVAAVGLLSGTVGGPARIVATVGSLALLVAGYRVGHSGGALVYTHGAASAYAATTDTTAAGTAGQPEQSATPGAAVRPTPEAGDDDKH